MVSRGKTRNHEKTVAILRIEAAFKKKAQIWAMQNDMTFTDMILLGLSEVMAGNVGGNAAKGNWSKIMRNE